MIIERNKKHCVILAKMGIQLFADFLDSRLRGTSNLSVAATQGE